MQFVQNLPFISIIVSLFSGSLSSIMGGKKAKWLNLAMMSLVGLFSLLVFLFVLGTGESYVYMMGHFPAPWGNEIRIGVLEAGMALFFCIVMILCVIGGLSGALSAAYLVISLPVVIIWKIYRRIRFGYTLYQ